MGFKKSALRIANQLLDPMGVRLQRSTSADLSTEGVLKRAQDRFGSEIRGIIDVGASDGHWSEVAKQYFPTSEYLLIEAQPRHEAELKKCCKLNPKFKYSICAAGEREGEIYFDMSTAFGGLASEVPLTAHYQKIPVKTVDRLVADFNLNGPYLLKLDTHGYEVPILKGAVESLKKSAIIVMEVYNFDVAPNSLRFYQMCDLLEKQGFRCIDLSGPLLRPTDQAFWQIDLVFASKNLDLFRDNHYDSRISDSTQSI